MRGDNHVFLKNGRKIFVREDFNPSIELNPLAKSVFQRRRIRHLLAGLLAANWRNSIKSICPSGQVGSPRSSKDDCIRRPAELRRV
jgi:hypothetical protein